MKSRVPEIDEPYGLRIVRNGNYYGMVFYGLRVIHRVFDGHVKVVDSMDIQVGGTDSVRSIGFVHVTDGRPQVVDCRATQLLR